MKIYSVNKVSYSPSEYTRLVHEPALAYFRNKEDARNYAKELRPQLEQEDDLGKLRIEVFPHEVVKEYLPTVGIIYRFEDGMYIEKADLQ